MPAPCIWLTTTLAILALSLAVGHRLFPGIKMSSTLAPVYFISHGGPPSMYDTSSEPYKAWQEVGRRILNDVEDGRVSKGLVCVSAHWEADDQSGKVIEVNSDATNPLIYDFYGFPAHYYKETFTSSFPSSAVSDVVNALEPTFKTETTSRGLDHGLWVPFKIMFPSAAQTPSIIQLSLPGDSSPESAQRLGESLGKLRQQGYAVVATGQAVHNLGDFRRPSDQSYGEGFLKAAREAVEKETSTSAVQDLFRHPLYKKAHPTPEHLTPLAVAAGAALRSPAPAEVVIELDQGALGWLMARWQ